MDFIRSNSLTKEVAPLCLQPDAITNLLTSYIGVAFSVLSQTSVLEKSGDYLSDSRSKERTKLIKQNVQTLELLISYCRKTLSISQGLEETERTLLKFKRNCELGVQADLFVYEFDISEITHFLISRANSYATDQKNNPPDIFTLPKINLTLINYFIQLFLEIDLLWKISDERLRDISKLQITQFQDKHATKHISKNSLFIFIAISFKSPAMSL